MSSLSSLEKNCNNVHLHREAEVELLKKALADKQAELNAIRSACYRESDRQGELEDVVLAWQDKFERLYESHKKVQKINQGLEDKLLKLVDRNSGERAQLTSDCATLNIRLNQANYNISSLQREIERYKQDINLAIQLLHCKPDNFLPQKITSLPLEMQSKVASHMKLDSQSDTECSNIGNLTKGKYHILPTNDEEASLTSCHFPPGSVINSNGLDHNRNGELRVSPVVVAKFLESELKSKNVKHCDTCSCAKKHLLEGFQMLFNAGTQTENNSSHCMRCNSNLNSPSHTNSPYLMKLKSSDSVISETKSSVSDFANLNDKQFSPSKKDDLMVNPILGHHRLCEHTKTFSYPPFMQKEDEVDQPTELVVPKAPIIDGTRVKTSEVKQNGEDKVNGLQSQPTPLSHGAGNGSNNSIWSKTSSKEGAKLFESFNRNLIKTMRLQAENPRKVAPRICALKIQDGSNNIFLDNSQGDVKQVMYTRRPRLLDEELIDDDKDISGNVPMNFNVSMLSTPSNQSNNHNDGIFSTNKTDSEKFNEIQGGKEVLVANLIPVETDTTVVNECDVINSSKIFKASEVFCESVVIGNDVVHDNIMLRRQQLNRVAEWVQNSSNIPLPNSPEQKSNDPEKLNDSSQIKALDYENNNSVANKQIYAPLNNQVYKESIPLCEQNAQTCVSETLNDKNSSAEGVDIEQRSLSNKSQDGKIDLAQMEYNVKKFLLKQNEWSMNRPLSVDSYAGSKSECDEETIFVRSSYQRTETNL